MIDLGIVARLHACFSRALPRVTPFYAVKCMPEPGLMRMLAALGTGFDCASEAELAAVLAMGVPRERIIYAHPVKPPAQAWPCPRCLPGIEVADQRFSSLLSERVPARSMFSVIMWKLLQAEARRYLHTMQQVRRAGENGNDLPTAELLGKLVKLASHYEKAHLDTYASGALGG